MKKEYARTLKSVKAKIDPVNAHRDKDMTSKNSLLKSSRRTAAMQSAVEKTTLHRSGSSKEK
jgi:hypothetical protein